MRAFLFRPLGHPGRWAVVAALLVAGVAHLPVIRQHLMEAPYMGVLFIVLTATCFVLAAALISIDSRAVYALSVITCVLAVIGYAATRLIAFPMLVDDVGNWGEPLGVASILAETAVAVLAARLPRRAPSVEGAVALA